MDWQPIETVPKDGRVILVYHKRGTWRYPPDPFKINCVVVFWGGECFEQFGPNSFHESELSHWMPIPPVPE